MRKGYPLSAEAREKIRKAKRGKSLSYAHRLRISQSMRKFVEMEKGRRDADPAASV